MGFDWAGFSMGFGAVFTGFFFTWVIGLAAKMLDVGCD